MVVTCVFRFSRPTLVVALAVLWAGRRRARTGVEVPFSALFCDDRVGVAPLPVPTECQTTAT